MVKVTTELIGLSAVAFLLGVIVILFTGPILGVSAEGYSDLQ